MRTKKWPGLDADTEEYTDLFGPYDERIDVRGLDRLIGEGVVELPVECRSPLDILIEAEEKGIPSLTEREPMWIAMGTERSPYEILLEADLQTEPVMPPGFRPTSSARVIDWHAAGYRRSDDPAKRVVPKFACATASRLLEELRYQYSR